MTTYRSSAGGLVRRVPEPRSWARPPGLAMLALALVGLVQSGCQSTGCNGCGGLGGFGSRVSNGVQALGTRVANTSSRIFNHKGGGCSTCGDGGIEGGTIVEPGIPVAPGGMVVPGPATIVPAPGLESAPTQLEPIDGNGGASKPANPTGGTGTTNPAATRSQPANKQSAYEAYLPRNKTTRGRTTDVARAIHSTPNQARPAYNSGAPAESNDLLDHIPPVDVPAEVTQKAVSLPGSVSAPSPASSPAPSPGPATSNPPAGPVTEAGKVAAPTPAETVSAVEGASTASRLAPGIRRSASVAPSVGGGSAPSAEGLDWLKEKGYRTFLDLRSMSEFDPNFVESVNDHGMVYLSLPILAERLDASRLARFDDLIAQTENRPLYFCDSDGTRAGLVWYIHLRTVEGNDPQSAFQRAEEIGLTGAQARLGETFLATHKTRARSVAAPAPVPASPVAIAGASKSEAPRPVSASPAPTPPPSPVLAPAPADAPTAPRLPGEDRPQASAKPNLDRYREPIAWRPVAALVLTGIGVPLAYWSKSALSGVRSNRRRMASLPGSPRRSLDAPAGSDA
jgi:protein tyrosine phosphatase (PTP) superfamily phosphohydrolase (DUF442 family)